MWTTQTPTRGAAAAPTPGPRRPGRPWPAALRAPLLALALAGCGGGSELLLIPLFEFGFSGTSGGTQFQLFMGPDNPTTSSGTFDFANMNVDDGRPQIQYTGSYNGCNFTLSTTAAVAAPAAASYAGSFRGNDRIELRPTSGVGLPLLSLLRQGTGTRQSGC